jgi:hypothetical protein
MRAFFVVAVMALLVGVPVAGAAAHDGWFVRVCPAKTEAGRIHLAFSGGRQGYSWSWIKGRTPNEVDLPRRFHSVARLTVQRMEFDDHEDHERNWNDTDDCAC